MNKSGKIFLCILPIDNPQKMCYNRSLRKIGRITCERPAIIPQPAQFVNRQNKQKLKRKIINLPIDNFVNRQFVQN